MTEIPDHLLQRTRSRRQALGLPVSGGDAAAGSAAPAVAAGGGAVAAGGAALPKGPVAPSGPIERAKAAPKPAPHYVQAYQRRKKIPVWAMPALVGLPLWAVFYAGTLQPKPSKTLTTLAEGAVIYSGSCSSCHGASGGGGVGPALSNGAVLQTFPDPVDQVLWVVKGSSGGAVGGKYGATGKTSKGGMPNFGTAKTLSLEFIVDAVRHERETLSGEKFDEATAKKWAGLTKLAEDPALEGLYTPAAIEELLVKISTETGVKIPVEAAG